jgi:autotransporter-associated beta strand protein
LGTDFATNANWLLGVAPANDTTTDIATFGPISTFQPVLAADRSVNGLAFTDTSVVTISGAGAFTLGNSGINNSSSSGLKTVSNNLTLAAAQSFINNGALTLTGSVNNGGLLLTLDGTGAAGTLSGTISGTGGLTKAGTGQWILSGSNTYTGNTAINSGTLNAQANNALGTTGNATVTTGATLQVQGGVSLGQASTTLNGTGTAGNGALENVSGNNSLTGPVTVASASRIQSDVGTLTASGTVALGANTLNVGGAGNTTLSGIVSGTGGLTKDGAGTFLLSGANTFTGATTINGGLLSIGADNGLGAAPGSVTANQLVFNGGTLGTTATFTLSANRGTTLNAGGGTFDVGAGTTLTYGGILAGSGALTKVDTGTLVLSGANTYTGATAINAGALQLNSAGALGTAANTASTTVASGATLQLANNITTTNTGMLFLNGTGATGLGALLNVSGNNRWNSDVTIGSNSTIYSSTAGNTLYIGNAVFGTNLFSMGSNTVTIDGPGDVWFDANVGVSGDTGSFVKNGTGKVTFYAYNTFFTGPTFVNNGMLDLVVGPLSAGIYGINGALTIGDNIGSAGSAIVNIQSATYPGQISPSSAVTINSDGLLQVALSNGIGSLTLNGGRVSLAGVTLTPTGNITSNTNAAHQTALISGGALALGAGKTFTVDRDSTITSDLTVSSAISGGPLTKQGTGVLTLSGTNTLTGTTAINAGTLNAQATDALGTSGSTTVASGATLQVQGGFSFGQASTTLNGTGTAGNGALENVSGNNTLTGPITIASATRIQSDAGTLTASGTVALGANTLNVGGAGNTTLNGAISGTGGLTKDGAGTLALGSSNTFTGATAITAGSVIANATNVFNNSALLTVASGASLQLNSFSQTIGALAGAGTVNFGAGATLNLTNGSATFSGSLLGAGTLYLGSGSTLTLGANFNNANLNIVLAGGTLNLNGTTDTFGALSITGNSILDFGNSSASILNSSSLSFGGTGVTLTINNWVNTVDYFYVQNNPGGSPGSPPLNQITFTGGTYTNNDTKWQSYDHQITPAPEPAAYGAALTGFSALLLWWRRRHHVVA